MSPSPFIDFKAVKAAISIEQVLGHYGLLERMKRSGDSLSGCCPIHKGSNPTQFRVSISKNVWNCFSECKHGGNALDFISRMEDVTVHAAAMKAIEWFGIDPSAVEGDSGDEKETEGAKGDLPIQRKAEPSKETPPEKASSNPPLKFRLDKLESNHPYITERGLSPETVIYFGPGFCSKGMMANRIAIPIHNPEGKIVAYAGRWPGEPPEGTPKYKLPQGFRKSLELYNIDRAAKEESHAPLVIVEGFFGAMKINQLGHKKIVALMGSSMSKEQEALVQSVTVGNGRIIIMLDEDEAGRAGRDEIALRLARFAFVKIHVFPEEGRQPETMSAEELTASIA